MKKIYDCFTFVDELDILEIRLNTLYEHVDHFVIVEANKTHLGRDNELCFKNNKDRFEKFLDKVIHVEVTDMPNFSDDIWELEIFHRNCILRGLQGAHEDDIVIISDVDEIIMPEAIQKIRSTQKEFYAIRSFQFYSHLNSLLISERSLLPVMNFQSMATKLSHVKKHSPQSIRIFKNDLNEDDTLSFFEIEVEVIKDGGRHFSFIGDEQKFQVKLDRYTHPELRDSAHHFINFMYESKEKSSGFVAHNINLISTVNFYYANIELDDLFPQYIRDNLHKYKDVISSKVLCSLDQYSPELLKLGGK